MEGSLTESDHLGLEQLAIAQFPIDRFEDAFAAQASGAAGTKVQILPQG